MFGINLCRFLNCFDKLPPFTRTGFDLTTLKLQSPQAETIALDHAS
jgi:hypothetical protein